MMNRRTLLPLLAGTAFMGMAHSALALDGNDVLAKINAAAALGGLEFKAASVVTEGATVILKDARAEGPAGTAPFGDITLEGVKEAANGYDIGKISFADINVSRNGVTLTVSDMWFSGAHIPADAAAGTLQSLLLYESAHAGPLKLVSKGKTVLSIDEMNATTDLTDTNQLDYDFNVTGIALDLTTVEDAGMADAVSKLGLQQVNGAVTAKASWALDEGKVNLTQSTLDFQNIGRLTMQFGLSGYTMEVVKRMQEATRAASANPDKAAAEQTMDIALMGVMQQLSFTGASIRFDDAGITRKALDYAGSRQGVDGAQMAQSLKGMLPIMIGQLNMPDLQAQVTAAANAFLDDPKSIEVSATPALPVPFPHIMGAAMGAPQTLPQVLGVKIVANP